MSRINLALPLVFALSACPSDPDPVDQCKKLISTMCARVASCAEDADVIDEDYSAEELRTDCEDEIGSSLKCGKAVDVSENYDQCVKDLKRVDCDESNDSLISDMMLLPPPDSCQDVILLE